MTLKFLEEEFIKFKNIPFPRDSSDTEELGDVFTDLVLFDDYVAGAIDRLIVGKKVEESELIYDQVLEDRITKLIEKAISKEDKMTAMSYLEYLMSIKSLLLIAKQL